jgi:ATP-binding protein involved in chromosome partitioning
MMVDKDIVLDVLESIVHPEADVGLVSGGFVSDVSVSGDGIVVELKFRRVRDPFAASLRRQVEAALSERFGGVGVSVGIHSPEVAPKAEPSRRLPGVKHVVAVASGKGGVGKSTVAACLARELVSKGYRVGILDADIYGPSQPSLFGVSDYLPASEGIEGSENIVPAESGGVKIMSIGFFIAPDDALVWRGPMAVNALRQLIHQTAWGELDFLLVDLPPGTGDVHLSIVHDLELDGAIVVTTPGSLAVADVRRGVGMFRSEGVGVPVLGLVENMAWFTPAELPDNRYYIFGNGDGRNFADEAGIEFLGDIPLVLPAGGSVESELSESGIQPGLQPFYETIGRRVVDKLAAKC